MMKKAKPKLTRQDAERLFAGLPGALGQPGGRSTSSASRPVNPFEANPFGETAPSANPFETSARTGNDAGIWKDNLVNLPIAVELPAAYETAVRFRVALARAWQLRWVREAGHEVVTEFPEGWKAVRPASGPIELRDPAGIVRAVYGWAEDAELRVLSRYTLEAQSNSTTGLGSLLIRDRANGKILERSSIWSAMSGKTHPDWPRLSGWLNQQFPQHRDPLRYWEDCEARATAQAGAPGA